ncbi:phosphate ABC transporter ATP-binding protein [filamentous cyanobacterium LEGE 11480]|uniref:Phosphate ABC transporter ATP-binding protein n=1 Tax=Romeriopsis navalis LEGE 11480 TaxID=2777977 RepID=A0A928VL18_9CYAN|nr:phosphate ABC transporter ATP-binding protein [Romeriopsis navalis]MBE9028571.1 phosphate ABC transporter ATP-binding protein [Romeriopsis navalis LEGE 11480]
MPHPPSLATQNLTLRYGRKVAVENVNLTVPAGKITALIGPSGCGKTSFLNCLNRLVELTPQAKVTGQVLLGDVDIRSIPVVTLRRRVGMLFQQPNPFPLSIYENLAFPLREHGLRDKVAITGTIEASLRQVGLWDEICDRLKHPALALSGGQQQRLCLARALALKPQVILMDEPCSALDPLSSEIVESLMRDLRGEYTLLVVTHNLAQARRIADQTALFWAVDGVGKLVEMGDTEQIFDQPQDDLTAAYVTGRKG